MCGSNRRRTHSNRETVHTDADDEDNVEEEDTAIESDRHYQILAANGHLAADLPSIRCRVELLRSLLSVTTVGYRTVASRPS